MPPLRRLGIVAGGVVVYALGYILFDMLLGDFYAANSGSAVGAARDPQILWAVAVAALAYAALIIYALKAQAALLRFLQDGSYRRVGGVGSRHSEARIIVASNARLEELADVGRLERGRVGAADFQEIERLRDNFFWKSRRCLVRRSKTNRKVRSLSASARSPARCDNPVLPRVRSRP